LSPEDAWSGRRETERDVRGEYKVPGGKLVAVDVETHSGSSGDVIASAAVSGDFFLEPDDALDAINAALTGLSRHSAADALAAAVQAGLPPGTLMYGIAPEAVAVAVLRAADGAQA
jgi:lipoate-protein ligase A